MIKKKYLILIYALLFIFPGNLDKLKSSTNIPDINSSIDLDTNYLKKIPSGEYIIGTGDLLNIIVSRDYPELTVNALIDLEGTINVPKLNRIFVSGLTLNELNKILNKAFLEYVKYPEVEVSVIRYRPIRILIQGEIINPGMKRMDGFVNVPNLNINNQNDVGVNKGGRFNTSNADVNGENFFPTLFDLIRLSGGITEYSDLSNIKIIRKNKISNGGGYLTKVFDFDQILNSNQSNLSVRVFDDDKIFISKSDKPDINFLKEAYKLNLNPKFLKVLVTGKVIYPGTLDIPNQSVLNDALDIAGGTRIIKGPITFLRINSNGLIERRRFRHNKKAKKGSYKNPIIRDRDIIIVGKGNLSNISEVINEFTQPFTGILSTYGLVKIIEE